MIVQRRTKLAESGSSITLLGQVCNNLASQVALTSRTYQMVSAAELEKHGVHWMLCRRWVRRFLGASGHSYKKPGVDATKEHGHGVSIVYIASLRSVVERCTVIGGMWLSLLRPWNNQERNGCPLHSCRLVFSRDWLFLVLRKQMPKQRLGDLRTQCWRDSVKMAVSFRWPKRAAHEVHQVQTQCRAVLGWFGGLFQHLVRNQSFLRCGIPALAPVFTGPSHVLLQTTRLAVVACASLVLLVTARSGACVSICLNRGKLTRSRHSKE